MPRTAFYPGSFDPVTLGHMDVIARACRIVDRLVIGVGTHETKRPLFSAEDRVAMLSEEVTSIAGRTGIEIDIVTFAGLAVDAAQDAGASIIVRGLRDATDFDYEVQMAGMNGAMAPGLDTLFFPASPDTRHIAASLVRQIAAMGGDVAPFVSSAVARKLKARMKPRG
ncbi:MAG TPA: pantetheine-phosphate adenylyltransferase [Hyphomicrobium sp.]|nr:pantetheine-phosphate adenylyltransferase [Hyphomicrobium sp.]